MKCLYSLPFFILLSFPVFCSTMEELPWLGKWMEYQFQTDYRFEMYQDLDTKEGSKTYTSSDSYLDFALGLVPYPKLSAQVLLMFANTRQMSFNFANAQAMLRYRWLSDIEGSPLALTTQFHAIFPTTDALHDYSQIYHGNSNFEVYT